MEYYKGRLIKKGNAAKKIEKRLRSAIQLSSSKITGYMFKSCSGPYHTIITIPRVKRTSRGNEQGVFEVPSTKLFPL